MPCSPATCPNETALCMRSAWGSADAVTATAGVAVVILTSLPWAPGGIATGGSGEPGDHAGGASREAGRSGKGWRGEGTAGLGWSTGRVALVCSACASRSSPWFPGLSRQRFHPGWSPGAGSQESIEHVLIFGVFYSIRLPVRRPCWPGTSRSSLQPITQPITSPRVSKASAAPSVSAGQRKGRDKAQVCVHPKPDCACAILTPREMGS